jgi:hypothetical protein
MKQVLVIACLFTLIACKKNEAGGSSEISGKVTHHEKVIPYSRVFIKYNAKEFPGSDTSRYDAKFSTGLDGAYSFKLYKGDYFLYGYGYDPGVPGAVAGGIHIGLRKNEKSTTNVPVTEL